jgi:hypothetical protein
MKRDEVWCLAVVDLFSYPSHVDTYHITKGSLNSVLENKLIIVYSQLRTYQDGEPSGCCYMQGTSILYVPGSRSLPLYERIRQL